jgi:Gpi18-like mannosyltransferase
VDRPTALQSVAAAWLTTRISSVLILVLVSIVGANARWPGLLSLSMWDGRWYAGIALRGYPNWNATLQQSGYPFFPAFPSFLRLSKALGVPYLVNGPLISMVAFGIGLVGVHRIARRHASADVATLAVWAAALSPMSAVFSMSYPSGLMLATTVWAVDFAEQGRDRWAGLLAAIACLTRPNGCAVLAALTVVAWHERPRLWALVGPSLVLLGWWVGMLWQWTGDPLIFITDKRAWAEVSLVDVITLRTMDPSAYTHIAVALGAVVLVWLVRRRIPRAWLVFMAVYLLPSTAMGVVGMGRSASECFPPFVAAALTLGSVPRRTQWACFSASATLFLLLTLAFGLHAVLP